jgi:hypothetical protein
MPARLQGAHRARVALGAASWSGPTRMPARWLGARRAHVTATTADSSGSADDSGSVDDSSDLSKELNDLVFKMPRLITPERASYEKYRKRNADRNERNAQSQVTAYEEIDLENPVGEPKQPAPPAETEVSTPIEFEIDASAYEEEDVYVVQDIEAEDTDATDTYLDSL